MSQRFLYTVSFKLKVIKYAKKHGNRAADRHFGPPPIESVIRLEATGRIASSDGKTEEGNARETSEEAGGGAGGEDRDSGAASNWDLCFHQDDTRR